jgi:hypothetical protein
MRYRLSTVERNVMEGAMQLGLALVGIVFLSSTGLSMAQAIPKGLDASCHGPFERYKAAPGLKAFAAGKHMGCGWQRQGPGFTEIETIRAQAIRQCTSNGGDACKIVHQVK